MGSIDSQFSAIRVVYKFCAAAEEVGFNLHLISKLADDRELLRETLDKLRLELQSASTQTLEQGSAKKRGPSKLRKLLDTPLHDIDNFSVRTMNSLRNHNILSVGDLVRVTEEDLMHVKNFGRICSSDVVRFLQENKLNLSMKFVNHGNGVRVTDRGVEFIGN